MTDRDEIEAILDRYRTAVYTKDVEAFIGLYDEDTRVFDLWGRWSYRGSAEWRKPAEEWFGSLGTERSSPEFHDVQFEIGDGVAAVHAFITYKGPSRRRRGSSAAPRSSTSTPRRRRTSTPAESPCGGFSSARRQSLSSTRSIRKLREKAPVLLIT